eukprot:scaffold216334_cov32-Tisochrysis_lutea.AAC.1
MAMTRDNVKQWRPVQKLQNLTTDVDECTRLMTLALMCCQAIAKQTSDIDVRAVGSHGDRLPDPPDRPIYHELDQKYSSA